VSNISGVIDKFITVVNPSIFGYTRIYSIALRKSKLSTELLQRIRLVGIIGYRFEVLGGVTGLGLGVGKKMKTRYEYYYIHCNRRGIVGLIEICNYEVSYILTKTDYAIIKELVK
jgi:hypothetical protein